MCAPAPAPPTTAPSTAPCPPGYPSPPAASPVVEASRTGQDTWSRRQAMEAGRVSRPGTRSGPATPPPVPCPWTVSSPPGAPSLPAARPAVEAITPGSELWSPRPAVEAPCATTRGLRSDLATTRNALKKMIQVRIGTNLL